jgi:hypothetical protein
VEAIMKRNAKNLRSKNKHKRTNTEFRTEIEEIKMLKSYIRKIEARLRTVGWCISTTKSGELRRGATGELTESRGHHYDHATHIKFCTFPDKVSNMHMDAEMLDIRRRLRMQQRLAAVNEGQQKNVTCAKRSQN